MNKFKGRLIPALLLFGAVSAFSCSKEEEQKTYDVFSVTFEDSLFHFDGETRIMKITSTSAWSIIEDAEWIEVSETEGGAFAGEPASVEIVVDANAGEERSAELTVKMGAESRNFTISQMKHVEKVFSLSGEPESYDGDAVIDHPLQITSYDEWSISSNQPWVTFSKSAGDACAEKATTINMNVEFNFFDAREATVVLKSKNGSESQSFKIEQPKWVRPVTKYQVGDPEVTFDESKFDANYRYNDQMQIWRTAGVEGGIPHEADVLAKVTKTFESGTPVTEIKEYFEQNQGKAVVVLLKNGEYHFDMTVRLWSNATLMGESRDGVVINVGPEVVDGKQNTLDLYKANNVGIRNLTLHGAWLNEDGENTPKYDWNEELPGMGSRRTISINGSNSYVDNVKITNAASHPIYMGGSHNTIRNVEIKDAFCKAGGAQGYFFIDGNRHLITGCKIIGIRHFSMQNPTSMQNVVYHNDFSQEVTFHNNDGGDNLVEYNRVYLPPTMPDAYNAIMGPWASEHKVGGLNFIYKNRCKEDNVGRGGKTPWSDNRLYLGPQESSVGKDNPNRYLNFAPTVAADFPPHGTLYPVILN